MLEWLRQNLPEGYADAVLWVGLALIVLFVLLVLLRLLRRLRAGTFVLGGRNRRTRLAVMDATAVDSRRRLVLVRRDDVEHLILIGGPTDVVVEQDIRMIPRPARVPEAAPAEAPRQGPSQAEVQRARDLVQPQQRASDPPRPVTPPRPAAQAAASSNTALPRPQMPMSTPPSPPSTTSRYPAASSTASAPRSGSTPQLPPAKDLGDELLKDIDLTLNELAPPAKPKTSPDEDMTRLLGELTKR